ncbi:MAG TPA: LemA family protein [Caulobacter sp.]|nr:LemA family protein [Caulobacter sp.]
MTLIIILVVIVLVGLMAVGLYNRLVALNTRADQAFADIDVQLRQRHDLIPNLVETVKGYATHEKGTLEAVIAARNAATSAGSVADKVQAENALTGALRQMFAVAEAYPELKANTNFLSLQSELSDVENKLAAARRFFNSAVAEFNAARLSFPAVLFAGMFGFNARALFDLGEQRAAMDAAPEVKF